MGESANLGPLRLSCFSPARRGRAGRRRPSAARASNCNWNSWERPSVLPNLTREEKEYPLDGFPEWKLVVRGYFPNFKMDGPVPKSVGDEPLNPAVAFDLIGPKVKGVVLKPDAGDQHISPPQDPSVIAPRLERYFVFAKGDQVIGGTHHGEPTGLKPKLVVNGTGAGSADPIEETERRGILLRHGERQTHVHAEISTSQDRRPGRLNSRSPCSVDWAPGGAIRRARVASVGATQDGLFAPAGFEIQRHGKQRQPGSEDSGDARQ